MASEPRWLSAAEVAELNRLIVSDTGEPFGLRDAGLLDSACHRPVHLHVYEGVDDVVVLAARLLFSIALNHPFEQGNKRTGFEAAVIFLELNGYDIGVPDNGALAELIVGVIESRFSEASFVYTVRKHIVPYG